MKDPIGTGDVVETGPSLSFWIIGALALTWNLIGFYAYYVQVSTPIEELARGLSPEQAALLEAMPAWATSASAIAVTAGVLGSVLLLMRRAWAVPVFILSLAGVLFQDLYIFVLSDSVRVFGQQIVAIQATVLVIAVALVWYSRRAKDRGWLN